ncbi:hypothetical protein BA895_18500 [Humibacillus sp. DSM 29435]|uniref:hypothetical protein n=1 Tax=Humibacillus sp. DSM 29435 TaxID=1869167 RepID=UPI0008733CBA|nr:hypothetical protein [Humibacillus sp. DSM 29435]OFE16963.1 hypothetical protein BA895_18500 [Humibacillus sp. DSM 29435]
MTASTPPGEPGDVSDLERLVRDALEHEASRAPLGSRLVDAVSERTDGSGRRRFWLRSPGLRRPLVLAAAVFALAAVVVGVALLLGRAASGLLPAGGSVSAEATSVSPLTSRVDLVGSGRCAGLALQVEQPGGAAGGANPLVTWVRPGADNRLTVDGNDLRYLHAEGPCVDRLSYDIVSLDGPSGLQGANGTVGQRFNDEEGIGLLVSASATKARARIDVRLTCPGGDGCAAPDTAVASIVVSVVPPFLDGETSAPTALPTVTTSILATSGSETFTDSVVAPGAAAGTGGPVPTTTVTLTATPSP